MCVCVCECVCVCVCVSVCVRERERERERGEVSGGDCEDREWRECERPQERLLWGGGGG